MLNKLQISKLKNGGKSSIELSVQRFKKKKINEIKMAI